MRSVSLTADARRLAIARIMEARFLLVAFEEARDGRPANWIWPDNAMGNLIGRGIRGQAVLEKKRLEGASDALLCAELANLPSSD
jgi:hypothetical protein